MTLAVRSHRARHHRSWPRATVGAFGGQRRLFGGLIVHAGVAVVAVALAIAPTYSADRSALMGPGDAIRLRGYEITYLDSNQQAGGDRTVETVTFGILQDGRDIGSLAPAITQYSSGQEVGTPSVRTGLIEDLYLSLSSPPDDDGQIGLRARVNPMMLWLWVGLGVMGLGTAFAGWPTRRRKPTTSHVEVHVTPDVEASDVSTTPSVRAPEGVL